MDSFVIDCSLVNTEASQWNGLMDNTKINKKKFLEAIIDYAEKSGKFNPHFYRKEMMNFLKISEKEFNIIQKILGDKYCQFVASYEDDARYRINYSECLTLKEQYDQEIRAENRHKQIVRLAVLVAILGALISVVFNIWLTE